MNKTWFRRMIWSYIPIFFAIFSFIFLLCFQTLTEQNKRNAKESSEVFTGQLLQSIDVSLKSVDYTVIRELLNNKRFAAFFDERDSSDVFLNYEVAKHLSTLQKEIPLIDSYYLVRYSDGIVYNGNLTKHTNDFEDLPFINRVRAAKLSSAWMGFRDYREFSFQNPKRVVSLVHQFPLGAGTEGLFVVNINALSLQDLVQSMYDRDSAFVNVYDRDGHSLFNVEDESAAGKVLASTSSVYTGWKVESGVKSALVGTLSRTSSVWLFLGFILFLAGMGSIVYVTRKHYKPLEELVIRVHNRLSEEKPLQGDKPASDEFAFIHSAIDNFAEQSKRFKKEYEEAAVHKRINFFSELGSGGEHILSYRDSLPFPLYERLKVMVLEIDNSEHAFFRYSQQDQSSFKYVLSSVSNETIHAHMSGVWLEWTSSLQLTGLLFLDSREPDMKGIGEEIIRWVGKNLPFTSTIGIGGTVNSLGEVARSCREAHESLKFKAVLGGGRVLIHGEARHTAGKETNKHLRAIQALVQSFLQQDNEWAMHFEGWFEGIRHDCLSRSEISELSYYFVSHMDCHLSQLTRSEYELWSADAMESARHRIRSFDTLEELQLSLHRILENCAARLGGMRENRQHHQLMKNVRDYLERNYANPDLSLDHLSDIFAINAKYLSQLFKQEFGENFLEFLAQVRIRHAKTWLAEQGAPIQDVGERVGYVNAATFRRVFRRVEGVSPIDYRRRYELERNG
jgi:two-component system response regulator YesN